MYGGAEELETKYIRQEYSSGMEGTNKQEKKVKTKVIIQQPICC